MAKFQNKYRIESNRWQDWNYSNIGSYFITICTNCREKILGEIIDDKMILSASGEIVKSEITEISSYFDGVMIDEWVIMPNHIHLIITLNPVVNVEAIPVEAIHELPLPPKNTKNDDRKQRRQMIISKIIGKFKMKTSKQINIINNTIGYKNWQSNYHDHVIRDEKEYNRIKQYIIDNPQNWNHDKFHNE